MKFYISGAISNDEDYITKFANAEKFLSEEGHTVINPSTTHFNQHYSKRDYMLHDCIDVLSCDAIYMLNGWEKGTGAKAEMYLAKSVDIAVFFEKNYRKVK